MDSDPIENEPADPSNIELYGEPGTEFHLFLDQQSEAMPALLVSSDDPYLYVVSCNGVRMAITFEPLIAGMKAWIRAFDGDTLTKPKSEDLDGVVVVEI